MGRNRILSRYTQEYKNHLPQTSVKYYQSDNTHTFESRSDLPAWTFRGIDNKMEPLLTAQLLFPHLFTPLAN